MEITAEQFKTYLDVQHSGVTNMFDVITVTKLTGLTREQITYIMGNYKELYNEHVTTAS